MKKIYAIFVCLLFIGTMLAAAAVVVAPKPEKPGKPGGGGGGPTPTGTIFFNYNDGTDLSIWTMKADGSGKTKVTTCTSATQSLSRLEHGSHYWYLGFAPVDGTYPDGFQRYELFAIRDDNSKTVQLTNDATISISQDWVQPVWGPSDGSLSWVAKKFIGDTATEAGIYTASTTFDANGDLTSIGTVGLLWECGMWYDSSNEMYLPVIGSFDLSPDGSDLVVSHDSGLYIVDLSAETETYLAMGYTPKWSPDGNKIAYHYNHNVNTINIDGTGAKILVTVKNTKGWYSSTRHVTWSPDNNFVSYSKWGRSWSGGTYKSYVNIIGADGSGDRSLTNDLAATNPKNNLDWR